MSELLLILILLVLVLQWVNLTPRAIRDYFSWRYRELSRRAKKYLAKRKKGNR